MLDAVGMGRQGRCEHWNATCDLLTATGAARIDGGGWMLCVSVVSCHNTMGQTATNGDGKQTHERDMQLQGLVTPSAATESQVRSDRPHYLAAQVSIESPYTVRDSEPQIASNYRPVSANQSFTRRGQISTPVSLVEGGGRFY